MQVNPLPSTSSLPSWRLLGSIAVSAMLAAGCASTKLDEKPAPVAQAAAPTTTPAPAQSSMPAQVAAPAAPMMDPLNDPNSPLAKRSVFFDFDSSAIRGDAAPTIEAHGHYLAAHQDRKVEIEGNCDERGSREYNIALGQRRADAVKERLTLLGAGGPQISTVSYGKEKPRSLGHDEAAWADNRRADLNYH